MLVRNRHSEAIDESTDDMKLAICRQSTTTERVQTWRRAGIYGTPWSFKTCRQPGQCAQHQIESMPELKVTLCRQSRTRQMMPTWKRGRASGTIQRTLGNRTAMTARRALVTESALPEGLLHTLAALDPGLANFSSPLA